LVKVAQVHAYKKQYKAKDVLYSRFTIV